MLSRAASNTFTEKGYTPAHKEVDQSLNRDLYDQLIRGIADGRKKNEAEVRRLLDDFAVFERPRRVALLPRALTEEDGELTPTLKTKLRVVQENWPTQIARLFEDDGVPG